MTHSSNFLTQLLALRLRLHRAGRRDFGFTLIELLITVVIATIIVLGLLSLVVELSTTNRRELARTETQRDIGIALDYMASELREAAYVYTGECLGDGNDGSVAQAVRCPGLFGNNVLRMPRNRTPLVAFWKLDPIPENCTAPECDNYSISARTYTLVVYFLSTNDPNDIWQGQARLERATLAQFNRSGDANPEYVAPAQDGIGFRNWPDGEEDTGDRGIELSTPVALVDFVDRTPDQSVIPDERMCPQEPVRYSVTPGQDLLDENIRSVYACVRDDAETAAQQSDEGVERSAYNQKVVLFARGNPQGRYGLSCDEDEAKANLRTEGNPCKLPAIKTEVLNRGVADKIPRPLP